VLCVGFCVLWFSYCSIFSPVSANGSDRKVISEWPIMSGMLSPTVFMYLQLGKWAVYAYKLSAAIESNARKTAVTADTWIAQRKCAIPQWTMKNNCRNIIECGNNTHQGLPLTGKQTWACASDLGDASHVTCVVCNRWAVSCSFVTDNRAVVCWRVPWSV